MSLLRHLSVNARRVTVFVRPLSLSCRTLACCSRVGRVPDSQALYTGAQGKLLDLLPAGQCFSVRHFATEPSKHSVDEKQGERMENDLAQKPVSSLSRGEKLKLLVAQYGSVVMVFHISMSLTSLGLMYVAVSAGLDVVALASKLGVELGEGAAASASTFAVAYIAHKLLAPGRIAITAASVPLIVRWMRNMGYMTKPPPRQSDSSGDASTSDVPRTPQS